MRQRKKPRRESRCGKTLTKAELVNEYLNNKTFEKIINQFQDSNREKAKLGILIEEIKETMARKRVRKVESSENRIMLKQNESVLKSACESHEESRQKLATAFLTLSENIVRYAKFQLIDMDDAIQEGVMICFDKIDRFDSRKGKAFNYMTTCILNHFRQLYRTARNYNELKRKYLNYVQFLEGNSSFKNGRPMFENNN
jgi:DNA-directed RNA polymerase sigma subunit (sigma70/sigma32)